MSATLSLSFEIVNADITCVFRAVKHLSRRIHDPVPPTEVFFFGLEAVLSGHSPEMDTMPVRLVLLCHKTVPI